MNSKTKSMTDPECSDCHESPARFMLGGKSYCCECCRAAEAQRKADRKAQLAAAPRCELCNRRGSWRVSAGVLLCGKHKANMQRSHYAILAPMGGMGLFMPQPTYSRDDVLRMARDGAA